MNHTAAVMASFLVFTAGGCSAPHPGACRGLSDAEAFNEVRHQYPYPEFTKDRLLGVGRLDDAKEPDNSEIRLFFLLDKTSGKVEDAILFGDCGVKVIGTSVEGMKYAPVPVEPPNFDLRTAQSRLGSRQRSA
jgi:hypothetical protein